MVFNRILFNNIKEYTPVWMKTIPYNQTARSVVSTMVLQRQTNRHQEIIL